MSNGDFTYTVGGDFSQILREFAQLEDRARQAGQGIGKHLSEGIDESSLRSLNALTARLARLQQQQARIAVDSSQFAEAERQIRDVQGLIAAVNRQRITLGADPGSIVALRAQLDALNAKIGEVAIGSQRFRALQREISGVERELRKAGDAGGIAAKGINLASAAYGALGGIGAGLAITGFLRSSIQQAIELETATRRLTNTLGPQGAAGALGFVRGISDELGLSFKSLVGSYGRFSAAASAANVPLEQQQALFQSVSRAGMALGLSSDEVNGAFLALQQIASKGTVSMEELRQQLGERLPIALSATARGLGISQKEMIKLVETGQLSSNRFFPAFTKGLNELTEGASGMPTAAQNLQRFQNEWESLQVSFGQNLLPGVTYTVKQLTLAIEELKLQSRGVGLGLSSGIGGLGNENAALLGELNNLQKRFNLSESDFDKIFSDAIRLAKVRKDAFGALVFNEQTYQQALGNFEQLAANLRRRTPDRVSEENQRAAAARALADQLTEQANNQRTKLSTASQLDQVRLTEMEAQGIREVTKGLVSQLEVDRRLTRERVETLRKQVEGYDELIAKLEEAKAAGGGDQKQLSAALSARAGLVLEIARAEADGAQKVLDIRREERNLAIETLDIARTRLDLETQASGLIASRIRAQQDYNNAELNYQSASSDLTQSRFNVDRARQDYAIRAAEEELGAMRQRGASSGEIARLEQYIADLRRGAADIERRALEAAVTGAVQRFELEKRILMLKQAQQVIDAQNADRQSRQNTNQQEQKLLGLQRDALDPGLSSGQLANLNQAIALQQTAVRLAKEQEASDRSRYQNLAGIQALERDTLAMQQQTTANGFRAQAASKGWEESLAGPLNRLDAAAGATDRVATSTRTISTGFISAGGEVVKFYDTVQDISTTTSAIGAATGSLAGGYANANVEAKALLDTLQKLAATKPARWAGGPVDPSVAYQVNELGQESFLSPGGMLSLIHAPTRGTWRPPARGTVLPAGVTAGLKAQGAFGATPAAIGGGGAVGDALGNLGQAVRELRAEVRELRMKTWTTEVRVPGNSAILGAIGGLS